MIKSIICYSMKFNTLSLLKKAIASFKATKNVSIFVTGSNSRLLSGELATLLVGRTVEFKILPFNLRETYEYLKLKRFRC